MKLRYQILLGYTVPLALSFFSAGVVYTNAQGLKEAQADMLRVLQIEQNLGGLGVNLQVISRSTRGYLLDKSQTSRQSFDTARESSLKGLTDLDQRLVDPQQKALLVEIRKEVDGLIQTNLELMSLVDRGQLAAAIASWKAEGGRTQIERLTQKFEQFQERQNQIATATSKRQTDASDLLGWVVLGTSLLTLVLSGIVALWLVATIARQMNGTAGLLASSSSEIAATIEEQERTASNQAASVSETTATMDELGASSRQSAEQAESASAAAQQVLQLASEGNQAVSHTLEGMDDLRDKVGAIADQIVRLSDQTSQIGNISQLVTDLANQTNMLALNASVEAVRAGDHGKGFAVVAAEIRKLADQSKQSAQKINDLVSDIQGAIHTTVMVTDEGTKTVATGMQTSQRTAATFEAMARAIDSMALNNQQISLNIRQQSIAIQQVVQAMATIDRGAQQNADGIRQARVGTQQLNDAARAIQDMV